MPHNAIHGHGHNHDHADHLHSHVAEADTVDDLQVLTAQFIDGFREAKDKAAYLRIAGVPLEIDDPADQPAFDTLELPATSDPPARDPEPSDLGEAPRDQGGAGVGAEAQSIADAGRHGHHVLHRASYLYPDGVGARVDAERR